MIFSSAARIISLLLMACLLQSCGAAKFAYNQAPELAYWYLDGYVDFSGEQSLQVKKDLGKLQQWHRQTQLPNYVETIQQIQQKLPADVSPQDACNVWSDIRRHFVVLTDRPQPAVVAMLGTLTGDQIDAMARKFDKGNIEFLQDYVETTKPANQSKRYKRAISRAEKLYGRLDDKQLALVALQTDQSRFNGTLAYAERQRRQQDTLQTLRGLLKTKPSTDQKRQSVRALFDRAFTSPNPNYVAYVETVLQEGCKDFAELHNSTTPTQRRKAMATLTHYATDMKSLIAQGDG